MVSTFSSMLNEYLFGPSRPVRYWQRYKERLRLHGFDHRDIPNCRARALAKMEKRFKKQSNRLLIEEFTKRDYLLRNIGKDDSWTGGNLIVPFKGKIPGPGASWGSPDHSKAWK